MTHPESVRFCCSVVSDSLWPHGLSWASLSMDFSRQEYWSGFPFSSPGDLPNPRDWTQVSYIAGRFFSVWVTREAHPRVIQNSVNNRLCCAKSLQSCLTLWNAIDCGLPGFSVHGDSPGKNTGVDWHALLQGIFPTQGLNPYLLDLLPWQADSLPLAPSRKP